ncbi:MAG: hypothetical protein CSA36_02640 [Draconibacterium sp.]|nr:MAG: hypothetical protein CSA36_02640 [Draconibacterium sp.]
MFFLGISGQISTLILTVCLPCIFLVSGQKVLHVNTPANLLAIYQTQSGISFNCANVSNYPGDFYNEEKNTCFVLNNIHIIQDFPFDDFQVRRKSAYYKSSGNKAPPSPFSFC